MRGIDGRIRAALRTARAAVSWYRPAFPWVLAYMAQRLEYRPDGYVRWFWRTQDFSPSVVFGDGLASQDRAVALAWPARLLLLVLRCGMALQLAAGVALIVLWAWQNLVAGWQIGLALLVSYPVVWVHVAVVLLALGRLVEGVVYRRSRGLDKVVAKAAQKEKPVVGVVFGEPAISGRGDSTQAAVMSTTVLDSVIRPLEASGKYRVVPVYVAGDGRWYCDEGLGDSNLVASGEIDTWLRRHEPVTLSFYNGLSLVRPGKHLALGVAGRPHAVRLDVVFPVLCGAWGVGNGLLGMLEMAGVSSVGCDVVTSAVAMDSVLTRLVVQAHGIKVVPFVYCTRSEFKADTDRWVTQVNRKLHYPLLVRSARQAEASAGVTCVADPKGLRKAITLALKQDCKVLIEEDKRNVTKVRLTVMGNSDSEGELRLPVLECVPEREQLSHRLRAKVEAVGKDIYRALGCSGMVCVSLLADTAAEAVYCDGIQPLPLGLCQGDWQCAGAPLADVAVELVDMALKYHRQRPKP